jgi:phosphoglycolate phosphatase-like HAD superfamily hydrolase
MYGSYDKTDDYGRPMDLTRHVLFGSGAESVAFFGRTMHAAFSAAQARGLQTWMTIHVCYGHPKSRDDRYNGAEALRRKPAPAMLLEALAAHGVSADRALFVGDMDTDAGAAAAAGVAYQDASAFFQ